MSLVPLLFVIVLVLLILGGLPQVSGQWHAFGYYPSSLATVVLLVLIILLLTGRL